MSLASGPVGGRSVRPDRIDISVSMYHSIRMRTTLTLADDVYQAAKTLADGSGRSLGDVVSALARRGLKPQVQIPGDDDLPTFAVPPDADVIPGNLAQELLAEEGVE